MYETIIFDLDGTLLDTLDDLTSAVNAALGVKGLLPRTREEVRTFVGNGIKILIQRAARAAGGVYSHELLEEFRVYYAVHCADRTKPYKGILALLQELKARGLKTAVLSNKADFAVKELAEVYFGGLLLEAVGENEEAGIRKKPAPDALFAVMESLGAIKENTVYVGDSEVDIETAKNAGVDCICVTWGFRDRTLLEENGGIRFVDEPMEILRYCEG